MLEKGMRGGITQVIHLYAKVNNKYMAERCKPNKEYLQFLVANSLYGWAMCQSLPTDGFKWLLNVVGFTAKHIEKLVKRKSYGYILEVDVDYPDKTHDRHTQLPLINNAVKLVLNLKNKRNYLVHIGHSTTH